MKNRFYNEDALGAILALAMLGAEAGEQKKNESGEKESAEGRKDKVLSDAVLAAKEVYDEFIAVGFNEEQATQFVAALLH